MNILLNYTAKHGVGNIHSLIFAKKLIENGFNVYALLSNNIENREEWVNIGLIDLNFIDTYNTKLEFVFATIMFYFNKTKIKKYYQNIKFDYIFTPMTSLWSHYILKLFDHTTKITFIHDPFKHSGEYLQFFLQRTSKNIFLSDIIVVHSEKFINYIIDKYNYQGEIYYLPLPRHDFYLNTQNENIFVYDKDKINFLFFGRISKYKGISNLVDAYKKLKTENNQITLNIIGNGDLSDIENQILNTDDIRIVNRWIEDNEIQGFFVGENLVLVLPYVDATQSGVVLLGMEYSLPIIASNVGGISEQIIDNKSGLLVNPNDIDDLYSKMKILSQDKYKRDFLALNGNESIKKINWDDYFEKLVKRMYIDF